MPTPTIHFALNCLLRKWIGKFFTGVTKHGVHSAIYLCNGLLTPNKLVNIMNGSLANREVGFTLHFNMNSNQLLPFSSLSFILSPSPGLQPDLQSTRCTNTPANSVHSLCQMSSTNFIHQMYLSLTLTLPTKTPCDVTFARSGHWLLSWVCQPGCLCYD